jgi:hypothetical protein
MTALERGTKVVAKHPKYRGAWWGYIVSIDGDNAEVHFDIDKSTPSWNLPLAILHAPGPLPAQYENDGIGEHYWRKDCEVHAEYLAFQHKLATDPHASRSFSPDTYID